MLQNELSRYIEKIYKAHGFFKPLYFFFQNDQQNVQAQDLIKVNCELKTSLMKLFRWAIFFIWPQHCDLSLYLDRNAQKYQNFLHLQVQLTSGALRVSIVLVKGEKRLFAWQFKPQKLFLGTDYIAR